MKSFEIQIEKSMRLLMEAVSSFEMVTHSYQITRCHILKDSNLHSHRCENLKHYVIQLLYSTTRKWIGPLGKGSTSS